MKQEYIISAFTENNIGLLNRITIIFTRRKINIESLTVSESAIKGISKFTIVIEVTEDTVKKVVTQIEKQVEVLKAFYHTNEEMIFQEVALYKVSTEELMKTDLIEGLIRKYNARILEVTHDFTVIEKTGHKSETQEFFDQLNQFGVMQFIRSGRIAITRSSIERLSEFLRERDAILDKLSN
ncbi:acetolactate synthase small subunit [Saccharicrinis sp. FJH2]|uniref:acetolactate synthase small subunit n=1 Tax=Saccharicrinis sp. FJH65 TaxID=3344659 RepID=UPI0035F3665F